MVNVNPDLLEKKLATLEKVFSRAMEHEAEVIIEPYSKPHGVASQSARTAPPPASVERGYEFRVEGIDHSVRTEITSHPVEHSGNYTRAMGYFLDRAREKMDEYGLEHRLEEPAP